MLKIKKGGTLPKLYERQVFYITYCLLNGTKVFGVLLHLVLYFIISIVSDWGYFENRDKQ